MNKYLLTFKNKVIEEQYQRTCQENIRLEMLGLIVVCLIISFIVRIGQGLSDQNYLNVTTYAAMILYFVLQYDLAKRYKKLLRGSLILLNHVFTIYLVMVEESDDPYSSYLRGANQMGSNFLCILTGEYSDAIFSLLSLQTIRIIVVIVKSQKIEYYGILSAFIIILYASKQLHEYHKALRSQFLLSIREKSWDNIFNQVIKETPYLLMTFNEELLKFNITMLRNCERIVPNNQAALEFLRSSTNKKKTLEQIIFQEIIQFKRKQQEFFRVRLMIEYCRRKYSLEYSIFFGNQPTILIIFKDLIVRNSLGNVSFKQQQDAYYLNFVNKFCSMLLQVENKNYFIRLVQRKLLILKLSREICASWLRTRRINLNLLFQKLQKLYSNKKLNYEINESIDIVSCPQLINLFFTSILETLQSKNLNIHYRVHFHQYLEFQLSGQFDSANLQLLWVGLNNMCKSIITNMKITGRMISFKLFLVANIPFSYDRI